MSDIINKVSWSVLKEFTDDRGASIQWIVLQSQVYKVYAVDGPYSYQCIIPITDPASADQADFEANYKDSGNQVFKNFAYTGDRLKVDSEVTSSLPSTWSTTLRYEDMNASTGGVSRGSNIGNTFTNVYNQTGSGLFAGYLLTLENAFDEWEVRVIVDSITIYTFNTEDLEDSNVYGYDKGGDDDRQTTLGFSIHDKTIRWSPPLKYPMNYTSRIQVQARYVKGGSKKFRAGFVVRSA